MFSEDSNFIYYFGILMIGFVAVRIFYYFKFKRDTRLTEFDKSLWEFKFASVLCAVLIYFCVFYLPLTGFHARISPSDSQEKVVQQLVENQQKMGKEVDHLRQILYIAMFITAGYFFSVVTFIGKLQKTRQKDLIESDPTLKKPLGL
jgi:cytochrome b561